MRFLATFCFLENIYIQGWLEVLIDFSHFSAVAFCKDFFLVLCGVPNLDLILMCKGVSVPGISI